MGELKQNWLIAAAFLLGATLWVSGLSLPKPDRSQAGQLEIAPSVPLMLVGAFGDRYLAANLGSWRATVLGGGDLPDYSLAALAKIQEDVSWFNPRHEDNYYMATAVLPWNGYVDATQLILDRATESRINDPLPPFYLALNRLGFEGDVLGAAAALRIAARYVEEEPARLYFLELAGNWEEKKRDYSFPVTMLRKMAATSRSKSLKQFMELQVARLEGLAILGKAAEKFERDKQRSPLSLAELVTEGAIKKLPEDPTGVGYGLKNGNVILLSKQRYGETE